MAKGDLKKNIEGAKEEMGELLFATRDFADEVKKSSKEVFGIGTSANAATKAFKDIATSLTTMSSQMDGIVEGSVTVKDLAKEQNKYSKTQAKFQVEYSQALDKTKLSLKQKQSILRGEMAIQDVMSFQLKNMDGDLKNLLTSYGEQVKINKDNVKVMADMAKRTKEIQKGVGLAGAAFGSMGEILEKAGLGGIGSKMGLDEAVKEGRKLSAELTKGGGEAAGMGTKLKVAAKMAGTIGKNLMKSFGPIALIGVLVKEMLGTVVAVDEAAGSTAKNLGISYKQAIGLNQEYNEMSNLSKDMLVTGKQHKDAQDKLNEKFQTGGKFSAEIANSYAAIQTRTNLSDKAMGVLVKSQIKGKKTAKEQLGILNKTVVKFGIQNKMVFNVNKVMEKIAGASKSIHLSTKGNVAELAKTAMLAQKFGAEMSTIESIGSSLLDFETSLQNELEAELLLGKDINLEKARQYALMGDTAKLTEELLGQEAIMSAFKDGNVKSQEAAAKAIGLSRNELAEIIMKQEEQQALQDTFGDGIKDVNGAYDVYKQKLKEGKTEQQIFNELGSENLQQQLESMSAAEALAMVKAKEKEVLEANAATMLSSVESMENMAKLMMGMIDKGKKFAKIIGAVVLAYKAIQVISKAIQIIQAIRLGYQATMGSLKAREAIMEGASLTKSIGLAAMGAMSSLSAIPVVGWAAGLAAAGVAVALGMKYMSDGAVGPGGEMILNTGKGQIQFDKNDTIVAGTDLGGKGKKSESSGGSANNSDLIAKIDQLIKINQQIASKSTVIEMGGNEVGQGINTAEREIQ